MTKGPNSTIWKGRWNALSATMSALEGEPYQSLVCRLNAFAEKHFEYFYDGFIDKKHYDLTASKRWPPEHVLSVILGQVADDLAVIGRIADQQSDEPWSTRRKEADFLIRQALAPVLHLVREALELKKEKGIESAVVHTYFQKMAAIRVVPYASVLLIAIPLSCTYAPTDLLAIPHEVAHYVYWNGRVDRGKKRLRVALAEVLDSTKRPPPWLDSWVEELFADIYGCMVAGPLIALDFQDLQLQTSDESFVSDDGEHPTPVLRPYVYNKVLELERSDWATSLNSLWDWRLKEKRGNPSHVMIGEPIPLDIGREQLSNQVEKIWRFLKDTKFEPNWWRQEVWPKKEPPETQEASNLEKELKCLYASFDKALTGIPSEEGAAGEVFSSAETPQLNPQTKKYKHWQDALPQPENGEPSWLNIFAAEGWATKGPRTRK